MKRNNDLYYRFTFTDGHIEYWRIINGKYQHRVSDNNWHEYASEDLFWNSYRASATSLSSDSFIHLE